MPSLAGTILGSLGRPKEDLFSAPSWEAFAAPRKIYFWRPFSAILVGLVPAPLGEGISGSLGHPGIRIPGVLRSLREPKDGLRIAPGAPKKTQNPAGAAFAHPKVDGANPTAQGGHLAAMGGALAQLKVSK